MSDTLKAIVLINAMSAERMRLVLTLLAARTPCNVIAAATDLPADIPSTIGDIPRETDVITDNRVAVFLYNHSSGPDYIDFAVFPEFLKTIEEQGTKLHAIKWLYNHRKASLVAAKTIVEYLAFYHYIDPKFAGDAWNAENFSRITLHGWHQGK